MSLVGCATGPMLTDIESSIPPIPSGEGRIYLYRNAVFFGDGLRPAILLNGENIGNPIPDGFFFVDRPAGDYEISTTTEVERKLSFELAAGEEKYVRFNITMGIMIGHVYPELVNKDEALSEMEDMHYVGESF
jgi:hypothetical protein